MPISASITASCLTSIGSIPSQARTLICQAAAADLQDSDGSAVRLSPYSSSIELRFQPPCQPHLLGPGRYIFRLRDWLRVPLFRKSSVLTFEDRHARLADRLEAIIKCWKPMIRSIGRSALKGTAHRAVPKPRDPDAPSWRRPGQCAMLKLSADVDTPY